MISLQISLIRIKFDSTFDARESNAAFVTCDSNQRWPLKFFYRTFDVVQRRFFVQCRFRTAMVATGTSISPTLRWSNLILSNCGVNQLFP